MIKIFIQIVFQFVGYNDEILDMKFLGSSDHHVVVATNSNQVRLYNLTTMDCQLLAGHSGNVKILYFLFNILIDWKYFTLVFQGCDSVLLSHLQ